MFKIDGNTASVLSLTGEGFQVLVLMAPYLMFGYDIVINELYLSNVPGRLLSPEEERICQLEAYHYILLRKRSYTQADLDELDDVIYVYKLAIVKAFKEWNRYGRSRNSPSHFPTLLTVRSR